MKILTVILSLLFILPAFAQDIQLGPKYFLIDNIEGDEWSEGYLTINLYLSLDDLKTALKQISKDSVLPYVVVGTHMMSLTHLEIRATETIKVLDSEQVWEIGEPVVIPGIERK
jgi:hypothetical protein